MQVIIRNGLPPALVDDPFFRKALVTTSRIDQTVVYMGKGTDLGKRDTTLSHRDTFTRKFIPSTDKRLDEESTDKRLDESQKCRKLEVPSCQMDGNLQLPVP